MNRITNILGIKYPIIQAPLTWVTSAELVAAVSNAGGLGILGPNAGQKTLEKGINETAESFRQEIIKTKSLTDKPFGVNYLLSESPDPYSTHLLNILQDEGIKIIAAVGVANDAEIKKLKDRGFIVIFRELTPTIHGAKLAEEAGADIIGATGFDAGGYTPKTPVGTMTIVPLLADAVHVPILAVGGIVDRRTVNAAFALGAEGVYLGTRFMASEESPVDQVTKQNMVDYGTEDMVLYHTTYSYNRATPNKLALQLKEMEKDGKSGIEIDKVMYANGGLKSGMLEGNTDIGIDSYSSSIGLIKSIRSCKEIIEDLMQDVIL